jgi:hypothetical protein
MNPIQEIIINDYVEEIINNNVEEIHVNNVLDLGPLPQMVRTPPNNACEDFPLILDGHLPNDFAMPEPCENCYTFSCNGLCSQESQLPPPPPFTRMYTNAHLPPDELEDYSDEESDEFDMPEGIQYVSISRINTNADEPEHQLLVALSEAESKTYDEYEEVFLKEVEDQKQAQDQDQDK